MATVTITQRKQVQGVAVIALAVCFLALPAWAMSPVTLAGGGAAVSFPSTEVGQSFDVTVTINVNAPFMLAELSVSGDYSVKDSSCNAPVKLAPGDSCVVVITFSPAAPGTRWTPLLITDDTGREYSFGLIGNGTGPVLTFSPGLVSTAAGTGTVGYTGDGGPATSAQFNYPMGMVRDSQGNLYVADLANNVVRKISADGIIRTVAGNGSQGNSGDGGPATSAQLAWPASVALDAAGNLYIADFLNSSVRKVDASGQISTLANGFLVRGVTADNAGNVYFSSWSEGVWKVDPQGVIVRIAGNGTPGLSGDGGPATSAQTSGVTGLAIDPQGNLYMAEALNSDIRKVDTRGIITTVVGSEAGFSGDGGPATEARLNGPYDVRLDAAGNLYIADSGNNRIRKVNTAGIISTIAGRDYGYSGDGGLATDATFGGPTGLALDEKGNLFIADMGNSVIREVKVDSTSFDFRTVTVGQTGGPIPVIVSNAGNADLNIKDAVTSSAFAAQSKCSGGPIPAGGDCSLNVSFIPTDAGNITGTVNVIDDAAGNPHVINLKGAGYVAPKASDLVLTGQFSTFPLNSNLGVVAVLAMDANAHLVPDFSGTVTLQMQGPKGFTPYSGQVNAVAGTASFDLTAVILNVAGSYTITVSSPGLSSMQVVFDVAGGGDFALATSRQSLTVSGAGTGTLNVTLAPSNGFSGTIALTCSGLPVYTTCSFAPSTLRASGDNAALGSTLTISTGVATVAAVQRTDEPVFLAGSMGIFGAGLLGLVFAPMLRRKHESGSRHARMIQFIVVVIILCGGLIGCGSLGGKARVTPAGTYTVVVTATSGSVSHSSNITLVVQ